MQEVLAGQARESEGDWVVPTLADGDSPIGRVGNHSPSMVGGSTEVSCHGGVMPMLELKLLDSIFNWCYGGSPLFWRGSHHQASLRVQQTLSKIKPNVKKGVCSISYGASKF